MRVEIRAIRRIFEFLLPWGWFISREIAVRIVQDTGLKE